MKLLISMINKSIFNEEVNPLIGIRFVVILAVVIGVLVYFFNYLSTTRNTLMVNMYTSETNEYIIRNKKGLSLIFNSLFDESLKCNLQNSYQQQLNCEKEISKQIHTNLDDNIKDYSSLAFLRIDPKSERLERLNLSGNIQEAPISGKNKIEVIDLLNGKKERLRWDDYTYEFQDKEVIVPVIIDDKTIGAIVRGVIQ